MTIKVLPLDSWMHPRDYPPGAMEDTLRYYTPIEPVFGRPGRYWWKARPKALACWFELDDGRAFAYRTQDFQFAIGLLDASRLNSRQVAALEEVAVQKLATKDQRRLLYFCREARHLRQVVVSVRKRMTRWRKTKAELSKGCNEPS